MTEDDIERLVAIAATDGSSLSRKHLFRAITFAEVFSHIVRNNTVAERCDPLLLRDSRTALMR
ncbi:hypothetical protein [Mycobacterium avium]|uniref:hypothetical protein n=1 Tax=Mycobacterium avium TaxID=1764 RepID=UPI00207AB294|nr:hypothetical protein [Mycobacterium avium]MBG0727218.1 hypothetical protein [Mycobacterium avium]